MDKGFLIQLTNNLYRLTLLFPKKEPLRYKMRELADEILAKPNEKDLEILDSFFEVAMVQNWVSPSDILAIKKEYDKLKGELGLFKIQEKIENPGTGTMSEVELQSMAAQSSSKMPERQEKILAFLRENGRAQVWQVKQVFPEVTKRTLRRDFEQMLREGVIERIGERNDTFYQLKIVQS